MTTNHDRKIVKAPPEEGELDALMKEAAHELEPRAFEKSVQKAEAAGERAALRHVRNWVIGLAVLSAIAALFVQDARIAIPGILLLALYALPVILLSTRRAARDEKKDALREDIGQSNA